MGVILRRQPKDPHRTIREPSPGTTKILRFARLCENSDYNAIPEKPSLIHRAGATISIGGMILVSPFSPSVRVFTQSLAQDDNQLAAVRRTSGTRKTRPRLTARRGNSARHNRMVGGTPTSFQQAASSMFEGNGSRDVVSGAAVPITTDASADAEVSCGGTHHPVVPRPPRPR